MRIKDNLIKRVEFLFGVFLLALAILVVCLCILGILYTTFVDVAPILTLTLTSLFGIGLIGYGASSLYNIIKDNEWKWKQ